MIRVADRRIILETYLTSKNTKTVSKILTLTILQFDSVLPNYQSVPKEAQHRMFTLIIFCLHLSQLKIKRQLNIHYCKVRKKNNSNTNILLVLCRVE